MQFLLKEVGTIELYFTGISTNTPPMHKRIHLIASFVTVANSRAIQAQPVSSTLTNPSGAFGLST